MSKSMNEQNPINDALKVPFLPGDLPFNADQKQWLGGFMAGLHSRLLVTESQTSAAPQEAVVKKPITIIYGSQTGNAEAMAELAAEVAQTQDLAPSVLDMDDANLEQLSSAERLLVVTSTYGEGEMPDNAQALWDDIAADTAPRFDNTFFSVLALGDTSYDGFCVAGQMWDQRLEELGAQRINERVDCDVDFEEPSQQWIDATIPVIAAKGSQAGGSAADAPSAAPKKAKSKFNRQNPLPAELIGKKVVTGEASSKEICHFEFSLGDSGETYDAGDAINIITPNRQDLVEELLAVLGLEGTVTLADQGTSLQDVLVNQLEVRTPSKDFLQALAERSEDEAFQAMVADEDTQALSDYLWGKDVVDLLAHYPAAKFLAEEFVALCKPLAARAYSISSSIKKHDNEVHLTIGSVRYHSNERDHNGVCSTYLADIAEQGDTIQCYFAPNKNFSVPEDANLPMIMVGPGTGIAPFRAFLEEREMTEAKGQNWLFFGDRNASSDFIYKEELEAWQQQGVLNRLDLAFSRDQAEKVYVQDRMIENGEAFFEWLEQGAYFYICGDAYRMAKDVDKALHQIIETHGNRSSEEAIEYVNALKKQKRYVRDVY